MGRNLQFSQSLRARQPLVGYWSMLDSPVAIERVARIGYDYVCIDLQHGFADDQQLLAGLMGIAASGSSVGLVRVRENSVTAIGRALDAGAAGVIVPLVDDAAAAGAAVSASLYPPRGARSYGPIRSLPGQVVETGERDQSVVVLAMVETLDGLKNVRQICQTPGLAGIYIGPSDLSLALGARYPGDPQVQAALDAALVECLAAAQDAGVAAGIHCASGSIAATKLEQGFTFASVASDLMHLEANAREHFAAVQQVTV